MRNWAEANWPSGKMRRIFSKGRAFETQRGRQIFFFMPGACIARSRVGSAWHARVQRTRLIFFLKSDFFQNSLSVLSTLRPFLTHFLSFFRLDQKRKVVVPMGYFNFHRIKNQKISWLILRDIRVQSRKKKFRFPWKKFSDLTLLFTLKSTNTLRPRDTYEPIIRRSWPRKISTLSL